MTRTALITGASRGIGAATARRLAQDGWNLALTCEKNTDMLEQLADNLRARYGVTVCTRTMDVADPEQCVQAADAAREALGPIHALINNAGICHMGLLTDLSVEEWDRIIKVNLYATFYMCRALVPDMVRRRAGAVVNISSVWGNVGASCEAAYSAAKAGLNGLTRALAKELAPSSVTVNAIACGVIDTDMNKCLSPEELKTLYAEIPAGRPGTPEEAAQLVWQVLNSPAYLTGQVIGLDGGWM